jgi:hypothetical protein
MSITNLMRSEGPAIYYDPTFRVVIESHMQFLLQHPTVQSIDLDSQLTYKYENDLFGLLSEVGVPYQLHWIIMRMNNMNSPLELTQEHQSLLIPSDTVISNIQKVYSTTNKLNP